MGKIDIASAAWQEILNETKHGANTHVRVGNAGLAIIEAIIEVISGEATARQNADTNEATERAQAIATAVANLTAAINNEATARQNADTNEATTRAQAIATAFANLTAAINNEATARQNADTNEAIARDEAIGNAVLSKMDSLYGNTNLLFFGDCSGGFPAVSMQGELVFDTATSTLNASFLFNGQWQWIATELRQDTVYVYERSYYLWNSTAGLFTRLSDGSGAGAGIDEATLQKINIAYDMAATQLLTDDNYQPLTEDDGTYIFDM